MNIQRDCIQNQVSFGIGRFITIVNWVPIQSSHNKFYSGTVLFINNKHFVRNCTDFITFVQLHCNTVLEYVFELNIQNYVYGYYDITKTFL